MVYNFPFSDATDCCIRSETFGFPNHEECQNLSLTLVIGE